MFAKTGKHLDYVQDAILRGTLEDATYTQIAQELYSSPSHVRNVGSDLWKTLSKGLKKDITKNNFRAVLEKANFYNYQLAIVENVTAENITVNHNVNICSEKVRSPKTPQNPEPTTKQPRIDIGDAPEISTFCDRTSELSTLENWILSRTRLITILGLSGIGKTALTLQLIPQIQQEFDCIIWRSLHNSPHLASLQTDIIQSCRGGAPVPALSVPEERATTGGLPQKERAIAGGLPLLEYLRSYRCLLILDDLQTIFSSGQLAGNYQPGYENYGTFFKQIAESSHNSCLILNSWEKPREIAALEGENRPCKSLQLNGLGPEAQEIFREKGLAEPEKWSELIDLYRGNPLWLNIVATLIQDLFGGSVSEFLSYDTLFLGDLESLLEQQCDDRLTASEQQVIAWLASTSEPADISKIPENLQLSPPEVLKVIQSLGRRSLIETVKQNGRSHFTIQPVIREYIINKTRNKN
ncbi:MAG: ATP-binding protein [Oscillatoriales cyanobacterium]|nr:MAG: ATP-binding protein [Oscillatoriales cyanobacterium]